MNLGISGLNSRQYLRTVKSELFAREFMPPPSQKINYICILLGANDAAMGLETETHQGVPLDEYKDNIKQLVNEAYARFKAEEVFVIVPPPL